MNPSGKEAGATEGIDGRLLKRGDGVRGLLGSKSEFVSCGRGELLTWGEGLEGRMVVGPVTERTMRMYVCSVLCCTFVMMSRWLEVEEVLCVGCRL